MSTQDKIAEMKSGYEQELVKVQEMQAPIQAKIAALDSLSQDIEAEKTEFASVEKQKAFDEGHAKGIEVGFEQGLEQAKQAGGDDKLYSDAELNEELANATDKATKAAYAEALTIFQSGQAQETEVEKSIEEQLKSKSGQQ